ncbi:polymerase I B, chloroplastic/mitochondrial [Seminavis robusta]|uniref:Polymerase I B, chloroplastic/mitochondrial n=1 Tax=Seminavis robusta TaxID=568900 RepID=A0A9N8F1F6_9STRA|nr:polymerase I B, chloroplastic/mitochondrial [Seminavis robusta]|eukprot:Sro2579_g331800.1 polymerase I B, chloroplastic/mitochondrial (1183) ;mRNA; r:4335-7951
MGWTHGFQLSQRATTRRRPSSFLGSRRQAFLRPRDNGWNYPFGAATTGGNRYFQLPHSTLDGNCWPKLPRNRGGGIVQGRGRVRLLSAVSNPEPLVSDLQEGEGTLLNEQSDGVGISLIDRNSHKLNGANNERTQPKLQEEQLSTASATHDEELFSDLKSRPVPGGSWNPRAPLKWAEEFGRRSEENNNRLQSLIRLKEGDEGYFPVDPNETVPGVTIVRTKEQAKIVLEKLNQADPSIFHACDTEVMDIDLKKVGPVGNGYVTCISVYSGPEFDYGLGDGPGSILWIDNLDDAAGILQEFKEWFENENHLKVWHNYGFDRHVMWNEDIDVLGFGGDTLHMARLQDSSRARSGSGNGYSLEALSADLLNDKDEMKTSMKELFGVPRLRKDGTEGSLLDIPPVEVLQRDPTHRQKWIQYSCRDAKSTWQIRHILETKLKEEKWDEGSDEKNSRNLFDYYFLHMRPFGEVLTDMERRGIRVDAHDYLAGVEVQAREDRKHHSDQFRRWAQQQIGADGLALNPASAIQLQTFLFGGAINMKTKDKTEITRKFKVPIEEVPQEALDAYKTQPKEQKKSEEPEEQANDLDAMTAAQLKDICKERGLKLGGNKAQLKERLTKHLCGVTESEGDAGTFEILADALAETELAALDTLTISQLKPLCKERGLKVAGKKAELIERLKTYKPPDIPVDNPSAKGKLDADDDLDSMTENDLRDSLVARSLPKHGNRDDLLQRLRDDTRYKNALVAEKNPQDREDYVALSDALEAATKVEGSKLSEFIADVRQKAQADPKHIDVTVTSIGLEPIKFTAGGSPSVTADVLRTLAGDPFADPPKYGTAYERFGSGQAGHDACVALFSLCAIGSIDTMIANFLTSLQCLADEKERVHGSLNLNTETGRLSSRRPNLQNQPALEKDKYKIRQAFQASPGNNLIVADYGQLELRLLASMTGCKSMIEAFASGGDFHSRTALDMFDYVQEKVKSGECLLEWDYANGDPPKPLLKDLFASERRKAKTLNFSIAYGKTAHGLSQDWGVERKDAEEMLNAWYNARPEVRDWQAERKRIAREKGYTRTLMGRKRQLPEAMGKIPKLQGHAERASINTPIQGGAADVAMMAMNKINQSKKLERLGWILLLQIHDEVILEGPEETAEEAFDAVIECMQEPWALGLPQTSVPLLVDGSWTHKNWYDAK